MGYTPRVLVVGSGATATGIARDLAMRGLEVRLVAPDHLAATAHPPLLHSGARVAGSDPGVAARCRAENRILRRIADRWVEETGGVLTTPSGDDADDDRLRALREACEAVDIPVEPLDGTRAREIEPGLSEAITGGLFVPDATVDPFGLTVAQAASAREYGATVETVAGVTDVTVEDGRVSGVEIARDGATERIDPDYVVNAAGLRVGEVAAMAGVDLPVDPAVGVTLVANGSPTGAVVSRLPSVEGDGGRTDGEIASRGELVPFGRRSVLTGPTDTGADVVDSVDLLLEAASVSVPGVADARPLRASHGLRPEPGSGPEAASPGGGRVVDHDRRDDRWGFLSVLAGPPVLVRSVAEAATDRICSKFGIDRDCLTADHALPGSGAGPSGEELAEVTGLDPTVATRAADRLGERAADVLDAPGPNPVLCACESVTRVEVEDAVDRSPRRIDLDAVRVRTRATMGECQGGRCAHRLAGRLHPGREPAAVDRALGDLEASRWRGRRRALWGENLAGAMSTYAFHAATMNRDAEPAEYDLDAFDSGPVWEDPVPGDRSGDGDGGTA
jgi:glycerol-3-phosphate dehydrogenase